MSENKIKLKASFIYNVPLQIDEKDFFFIVNGQTFKTSRLISDLLSPNISRIHSIDPTFDKFIIKTQQLGDFSQILKLTSFENQEISLKEIGFISEVIEILGNENFNILREDESQEITIDNVIDLIRQHEQCPQFFSEELDDEIDFVSSHFFEIFDCENEEELMNISIETLIQIIGNKKLRLNDEDQLLNIVNYLYSNQTKYSILYEEVCFSNVSMNEMKEFIKIYDVNDLTSELWQNLSDRLICEVKNNEVLKKSRYKEKVDTFSKENGNEFRGILNYFMKKTDGNIEDEITISSSSYFNNSDVYKPFNVIDSDENEKYFWSKDLLNSWICFDFKDRRLILSDYSIKSIDVGPNYSHPRSWAVEGSNDNHFWEILDLQQNCSYLNGPSLVHTFHIHKRNLNEFRFIRLRQTGPNWRGNNFLAFKSFELFGKLV